MTARTGDSTAAFLAVAFLLAVGIVAGALHLAFGVFDADEFQHAHIAWLIAGGEVPYRDFWEHHGPLFGLANALLLRVTGAAPGIDLLYWCRGGSAVATALIAWLTYRVARSVDLGRLAAAAAAAIFLAVFFVHDKGVECRPDGWQGVFWLAGLLALLGALPRRRPATLLAAGALMGLAVLTNAKAGLGPLAVLGFYAFGARLHGLGLRGAARDLALLAAGGLLPYAAVVAWFASHGAVAEFHYYNLSWNLEAARFVAATSDRGWGYVGSLVKRQFPFVLAAAVGLGSWLAGLHRRRDPGSRGRRALLAAAALAGLVAPFLSLYSQFFLFLLPPWCVLAADGIARIADRLRQSAPRLAPSLLTLAAVAGLAIMAVQAARFAPRVEHPLLRRQKASLDRVLGEAPRDEPVGALWGDACGGYAFNARLQYWWGAEGLLGEFVEARTGRNPFGADFVAALERAGTRYVAGSDRGEILELPAVTRDYLRTRYDYADCLWTRRAANGASGAGGP